MIYTQPVPFSTGGKNVLVIPNSGYYMMPFPFGSNYSSMTLGCQVTFDTTSSLSGNAFNEVAPFGSGGATGFYLSLFYSSDFSTTFLPFQNNTVPSMGLTAWSFGFTGSFLSGTVGVPSQTGNVGYRQNPNTFVNGGFGVYYSTGVNFGPIFYPTGGGGGVMSGVPIDIGYKFIYSVAAEDCKTYISPSFYYIGQTGQQFALAIQQQNFPFGNIVTGYWTSGFSSGGGPLPLPNAFATFNPYFQNNLLLYNIMVNTGNTTYPL